MTEWKEKNDTCHLVQIVITRALNRSVSFNTSEYINLFDMSKVAIFLFLLPLSASVSAESVPDVSALKLSRKYSLSQTPRHHPSYLYPTRSYPQKEQYHLYSQAGDASTFPATNSHDFHIGSNSFGYSTIGQENWNPSAWNNSHVRYQAGHHREPIEGSHFNYKYQHMQHPQQDQPIYKKPFYHYGKGKFFKAPEKVRQKKAHYTYYGRPNGFKKAPYQRVYTPNTIHTYPMKKHGYQHYRRHYQTHFIIPASDMVRSKVKNFYAYGEDLSTISPASTTDRISREHSITSEATNYNGTYSFGSDSNTNYYTEQAKAEPGSFQESATRVYYGDRIYPNNKVSNQNAERGLRHRLYVPKSKSEEKEDGAGTVSHQ